MSNIFKSTKQFKHFVSTWSTAVNSDLARTTLVPCDEYRYDIKKGTIIEGWEPYGTNGYAHVRKGTGKLRVTGWIKAEHHLLYNILRKKPLHTGFNPVVNTGKIDPGTSNMHGFYDTVRILKSRVEDAQELVNDDEVVEQLKGKHPFIVMIDKLRGLLRESGDDDLLKSDASFRNLIDKLRTHLRNRPAGLLDEGSRRWKIKRVSEFLIPISESFTYRDLAKIDAEQLQSVMMFDRNDKENYWLTRAR